MRTGWYPVLLESSQDSRRLLYRTAQYGIFHFALPYAVLLQVYASEFRTQHLEQARGGIHPYSCRLLPMHLDGSPHRKDSLAERKMEGVKNEKLAIMNYELCIK